MFAFFADGMHGAGKGNYFAETRSRANAHFVSGDSERYDGWSAKIQEAASNGNRVVLMVQNVVFAWGAPVRLQPEAARRLDALVQAIQSVKGSIAGIYLYDEPYFNRGNSADRDVSAALTTASELVKSRFPGVPIIITYAWPDVERGAPIPESIDWLGVNCYLIMQDCTEQRVRAQFNSLNSMKAAHQRMVITLDAYWGEASTPQIEAQINKRIDLWLELATKADVAAYFPFLWQTQVSNVERLYGANGMPLVRDKLYAVFSENRGEPSPSPTPTPSPTPSPTPTPTSASCRSLEPVCLKTDLLRRDTCGKEIERWANAPQCNSKKCEGMDSVRRDSTGVEVERWKNAPQCAPAPTPTPTQTSQPMPQKCTALAPACERTDWVRRDSCGKEIERWVNAPQCNSTRCEGMDSVRRDSTGAEAERWRSAPQCAPAPTSTPTSQPTATSMPAKPAQPQCVVLAPACEGADSVRRDSCGEVIERWVKAPHCSTVRCEGMDYVRRDSVGKEFERWKNAPLCNGK